MQESNVSGIFAAAVKLPASERAAYLDRACGGDVALRQEVESLLKAHDQPGEFMQRPPIADATTTFGPGPERPGMRIGPYKLLQFLGEGGMGTVFLAEQTEPVRRMVALKIIKPGLDSAQVLARFEAERQALALMDHPNIAKVLDAGRIEKSQPRPFESGAGELLPDGRGSERPYFVMELVKGVPITEFCDKNKLATRQRLELFIPVCQAIQHAHMKGVIHRDVKPSNVLIALYDGKPVPKVIDFGVAKAMAEPLTRRTLFTQIGQIVGTFEYMSPEQATLNQLDIDTRSDIYSLGVLLYELLTGCTPIDKERLRTLAFDQMLRTIREEEPLRPSARLSSAAGALAMAAAYRGSNSQQLVGSLRGELDWIAMKALDKDRGRRYETASALATDVRRYLSEEPVEARPPTAWYRFRKMARRNRAAVAAIGMIAAALILGIVGTSVGLVRAVNAETLALVERDRAVGAEHEAKAKGQELEKALNALGRSTSLEKEARERENDERLKARLANQEADFARNTAKANETKEAWRLYAAQITAAQREWANNNLVRYQHYLDQCRPDFRGWEHDYLSTLVHRGRHTWRAHEAGFMSVAFSPDGTRVASASKDVKIWDLATGKDILTLAAHTDSVWCVEFSPDGKLLASASLDGTLRVWDLASGKEFKNLKGHTGQIWSVRFNSDGKRLASSSSDKTVKLWDLASGEEIRSLEGHIASVTTLAFSADGTRLASGGWMGDNTIKVWDVASGKEARTIKVPPPAVRMTLSPDGKRLASSSGTSMAVTVRLWDVDSGQEILKLDEGRGYVYLAFSPDGKRLAVAKDMLADMDGATGRLKLWDLATGKETPLKGNKAGIRSVAWSPDGNRIVTGAMDGSVTLWDTHDREALIIPVSGGGVNARAPYAVSSDGKNLATSSVGLGKLPKDFPKLEMKMKTMTTVGKIWIWDTFSGKRVMPEIALGTSNGPFVSSVAPNCLAYSPDGSHLAAGVSGRVRLWNTATGEELGYANYSVNCLAFSHDGKLLAGGSEGTTVRLWDAAGEVVRDLEGHTSGVRNLAFSRDGKFLASASAKEARVWDPSSGKENLVFEGNTCVAFSYDSKLLATAAPDRTVKVWDLVNGQAVQTLKGHLGAIISVAFSPDGKRLASASADKTVRLWDVSSGQEVLTFQGEYFYFGVTFSPDGKRLISGSPNTVTIWDASKPMKEFRK